jgi:hypothetical protein
METSGGQQNHRVKRVALPSGKTIEVVYFDDQAAAQAQAEPQAETQAEAATPAPGRVEEDLHLCPDCDSVLVYPTQWGEVDRMQWEVTLRCPNCEWLHTGVYDQDTVERFDEELDRGTDNLVDDLKRLIRANMEEEIERFSKALVENHILPEDF